MNKILMMALLTTSSIIMAMDTSEINVRRPRPQYAYGMVPVLRMGVMYPTPSYNGHPYEPSTGTRGPSNTFPQSTYVRTLEEERFSITKQNEALRHQLRLVEGQLTLLRQDAQIRQDNEQILLNALLERDNALQEKEGAIKSLKAAAKRFETQIADEIAFRVASQKSASTKRNATAAAIEPPRAPSETESDREAAPSNKVRRKAANHKALD